jgi:hypothetical protein
LKKSPYFALLLLPVLFAPKLAYPATYTVTGAFEYKSLSWSTTEPGNDIWDGYPLLKMIGSCESNGDPNEEPRQFNTDGTLLRGYPNPNDVGAMQINVPTWGAKAKELGFDIYTYGGNIAMGKWIFDTYGSQPWKYSENCWHPKVAAH